MGPSDLALNYIFKLIRGCLLFLDFQILIQRANTQSLYPIKFKMDLGTGGSFSFEIKIESPTLREMVGEG